MPLTSLIALKNTMNEDQIFQKLSAMCARSEHCEHDMTEKMRRWQVSEEVQAAVMRRLVSGRFVDDERYAQAFANDKIRYNKWGKRKVEQALFMKHINGKIIASVLNSVSADDYLSVLRPLIEAKRRSTTASSDYELRCKLIRFALSRGFTMELIERVL